MELTKSQINKLGDRIRKNSTVQGDAKLLDNYRNSFDEAFELGITEIKKIIKPYSKKTTLTNRQTKTIISIKDKLVRLKTRLSEMQDIRGCRIVADDLVTVYKIINRIKNSKLFNDKIKIDPRDEEVGYKAIHLIVFVQDKPIEIQLRTRLQDLWANICEKYSSKENDLKYGIRDAEVKKSFKQLSDMFNEIDSFERVYSSLQKENLLNLSFKNAYRTWKSYKEMKKAKKDIEKSIGKNIN